MILNKNIGKAKSAYKRIKRQGSNIMEIENEKYEQKKKKEK